MLIALSVVFGLLTVYFALPLMGLVGRHQSLKWWSGRGSNLDLRIPAGATPLPI